MKKKLLSLLAVMLVLSLTACGGNAGSNSGTDAGPSLQSTASGGSWDAPAPTETPMEDMAYAEEAGGTVYSGAPENAKIIYTAELYLETKEFDAASQALADAVADAGGYFERRGVSGSQYRSLSCTVRIPAGNFLVFLDKAGETAHVTHRYEDSDDVSEVYYDNEARLATQRTKLERLQELLGQAEDMADIITIESAISETELQIEYLTGSLRKYDSQINFSTVTIRLDEVYRLSTDEEVPQTFGARFGAAFAAGFHRGVENIEDFAIAVARRWLSLLIFAAVIVIAAVLLRRLSRKRGARNIPVSSAKPDKVKEEEKPETKEK